MKYVKIIIITLIIISCNKTPHSPTYHTYEGYNDIPPTKITIELLNTGSAYFTSTGYQIPRTLCYIGIQTEKKKTFNFDVYYANYNNYMTITFISNNQAILEVDPDRFYFSSMTLTEIGN